MRWQFLMVAAAGCLLAADAPKDDPAKKEQTQLQGAWIVVSAERGGKALDELKDSRVKVEGDKLTITVASKKKEETARFKLNPTTKPKQIDILEGQTAALGIYSLEGDTLTICWTKGGKERPTALTTKDQPTWMMVVFKREKK